LAEHFISNSDDAVKIACSLSFSGVDAIKGEPVGQILRQLCELVTRTVEVIEDGCRRLGLLT
jgi:hypothetical protein